MRKFCQICDLPSNHILDRARFFSHRQLPGERIDLFISDLLYLAQRSRFQNMPVDQLTDQLTRDILVNGITDLKLRSELLRRPDLTLEEAAHACRTAAL